MPVSAANPLTILNDLPGIAPGIVATTARRRGPPVVPHARDPRIAWSAAAGRLIVGAEKLDGANAGVSLSSAGELLLQSDDHYLAGGGSERQFGNFKRWSAAHEDALLERRGDRYVMYGEWMARMRSMFYKRLPQLFCEFDGPTGPTAARRHRRAHPALACGGAVRAARTDRPHHYRPPAALFCAGGQQAGSER